MGGGQVVSKVAGEVGSKVGGEVAAKAGSEVASKAGSEVASKVGSEAAAKAGQQAGEQAMANAAAKQASSNVVANAGRDAAERSAEMAGQNVAKDTVGNASQEAVARQTGMGTKSPDMASQPGKELGENATDKAAEKAGENIQKDPEKGLKDLDKEDNKAASEEKQPENNKSTEEKEEKGDNNQDQGQEQGEGEEAPQKEKPGPGEEVNKKTGEIQDTSTKKVTKAAGRAFAAYLTKGDSVGADKDILKIPAVDKAVGRIADTVDKVPGSKLVSKVADKAGAPDLINDALDTAGDLKKGLEDLQKGNLAEASEKLKSAKESGDKLKENPLMQNAPGILNKKKIKRYLIIYSIPALLFLMIIFALGEHMGQFIDTIKKIGEAIIAPFVWIGNGIGSLIDLFTVDEVNMIEEVLYQTEGWDELSCGRQNMITAAATAAQLGVPYKLYGQPYASGAEGIPRSGFECSGFVRWVLWTGTGTDLGHLTTQGITDRIGTDFIEISKDELKPGDVGLKRKGGSDVERSIWNHTGIYGGDGTWWHSTSGKGVVRSQVDSFTVFLRYVGADDPNICSMNEGGTEQ